MPPAASESFRGWKLVRAGAIIQGLQAGLLMHSFTNYSVLLRSELGFSTTTLSAGFAMTRAESGLLGPLQGWLLDRYGPRTVMRIGALLMGGGFMLMSTIDSVVEFFFFYFITALGMSLSGFMSVTTALVNWFQRRRTTALAVAGAGFAAGGLLTPLVAFALTRWGWRTTAFVSGLIVLAVIFPLAGRIHHRPSDVGEHVDGIPPDQISADERTAPGVSSVHFTAREAMRTRAFWFISLGHMSALFVVGAVLLHLSLYLTSERDFSLQAASFVGGSLPLMQLGGQIIGGYLGDRIDKRLIATTAMFGHMIGLLLLAHADAVWMIWLFVPFHGLAWGARGPLMQAIRADYFGATSFGTIMGFSSLIVMFGMVGGPLFAGILVDVTGGYTIGFTILALATGAGSLFFAFATPPKLPVRDTTSARENV